MKENKMNKMKYQIQELIDYYKLRIGFLEEEPTADIARIVAMDLKDQIEQLERILKGEPTEAHNFQKDK